ncbi:MAG TPA: hypothetical protein VK524_26595, partial [Polyangiaceae bacterium]|nr:hypothetical protein [Polyangiaceae bacterium]
MRYVLFFLFQTLVFAGLGAVGYYLVEGLLAARRGGEQRKIGLAYIGSGVLVAASFATVQREVAALLRAYASGEAELGMRTLTGMTVAAV